MQSHERDYPDRFNERRKMPADTPASDSSDTSSEDGNGSGGRPPKPPSERRSPACSVCLTDQEKAEVERRAQAADLSISAYLRRRGLAKPVRPSAVRAHRRRLTRAAMSLEDIDRGSLPAPATKKIARAKSIIEDVINDTMT
jgi:hypothetical protein